MFPGYAGPSCPRVRVFNMRPSPVIVNEDSTTYGAFVLGQSLDVDIVEKLGIRQIRNCPDEIRPARVCPPRAIRCRRQTMAGPGPLAERQPCPQSALRPAFPDPQAGHANSAGGKLVCDVRTATGSGSGSRRDAQRPSNCAASAAALSARLLAKTRLRVRIASSAWLANRFAMSYWLRASVFRAW